MSKIIERQVQTDKKKSDLVKARIIKRNLVYIIGIPEEIATSEELIKNECLGQYGKILKIIVNKPNLLGQNKNQFSVYVTFSNEKEALVCRLALEEYKYKNSIIKASFGTTKYCTYYISKQKCLNSECLYLHSSAHVQDVYSQEQIYEQIKKLQIQQQEYFLKNLNKFIKESKQPTKESILPSFQTIVQKYQIPNKPEPIQNLVKSLNNQQKQRTINTLNLEMDNQYQIKKNIQDKNVGFINDLDKKIVQQYLEKSNNLNQSSRFDFVNEQDSTNNSSKNQESIKSYIISMIEQQKLNKNHKKKNHFEFLTGNGILNKSVAQSF